MDIPAAFVISAEFATIPVGVAVVVNAGLALHKWARGQEPTEPKDVPHSKPASVVPER